MFKKYIHLQRYGTPEVDGIHIGNCYVFPKIDGTNASVWIEDGVVCAGSRNRKLSLDNDNFDFLAYISQDENIKKYLHDNPNHRLFGEYLVPHTLKTYREDCWKKFYIFDVMDTQTENFIAYDLYSDNLKQYNLNVIPPLRIVNNGNIDDFLDITTINHYLIKDGHGVGEGIVLKNYNFVNKHGRTCWAKIVTNEFKDSHYSNMGTPKITKVSINEAIAEKYTTKQLCDKVYAKIVGQEGEWTSKMIPRLLQTVFYDVVREDCWNFVKENKLPTINFKDLQSYVFHNVKKHLPHLF